MNRVIVEVSTVFVMNVRIILRSWRAVEGRV
jgi:hypothetical protein